MAEPRAGSRPTRDEEPGDAYEAPGDAYEELASRYVKRARKVLATNKWERNAESEFLVGGANVFATLALAEAIRRHASS